MFAISNVCHSSRLRLNFLSRPWARTTGRENPGATGATGEDTIGAQNAAARKTGARKSGQHVLLLRRSQHNPGSIPPQVVLHSLNSLLLMPTVEKVVLHGLLLVHGHSLQLNLHMLTAQPGKLIAETAVPHRLLLVLHMLAAHACSQKGPPT